MVVISNTDIQKLLPRSVLKQFRGILMSDETPKKRENGYYIFNLDDSMGNASNNDDSIGTHWVGLVVRSQNSMYFDPFGKPPDDTIIKWLKRGRPNYEIWYSTSPIQHIESTNCGFYVINFLEDMAKPTEQPDLDKFYDAIHKDFSGKDQRKNEKKIQKRYNINEKTQKFSK